MNILRAVKPKKQIEEDIPGGHCIKLSAWFSSLLRSIFYTLLHAEILQLLNVGSEPCCSASYEFMEMRSSTVVSLCYFFFYLPFYF